MYVSSFDAVSMRSKRRTAMFSPIFCTSFWRIDSTGSPPIFMSESAATSTGFWVATSSASCLANVANSGLRATKSVSLFTSTIAPTRPSGDT